ncbi:hypothetical protein AAMO2058_001030800 [Amorphochlora amoebiformis]
MASAFVSNPAALTGGSEKHETIVYSLLKMQFGGDQTAGRPSALILTYIREDKLRIGQTIRVVALSKAKEYNGKIAIVCGEMTSRSRYPVMMFQTRKVVGLRSENLVRVLGGGAEMRVKVIVIGAGAAGLAAAKMLQDSKVSTLVLEGRGRLGGRMCTLSLPERKETGQKEMVVDMGASYIHNCDDTNEVYKIALKEKPVVAVGVNKRWADTELARWFDETTGENISNTTNTKIHLLHWKMAANMTRLAKKLGQEKAVQTDMLSIFEQAKAFILKQQKLELTPIEERVLETIKTRMWGYVSNMTETASELVRHLPQDEVDLEEFVGSKFHIIQYGSGLQLRVAMEDDPKVGKINAKDTGDRLLCNGYNSFLVKYLAKGNRILTNKSVDHVTIMSSQKGKRGRSKVAVRCRDGTTYQCDFVLCTVPIGVLQSENKMSSIKFTPTLPRAKLGAIRDIGSGAHGKIVLRFRPDQVFWPKSTPQLVPLDQRFHILNLHAYGKTGVLCAHVWPPFACNFGGKNDQKAVKELLNVLKGMFWRVPGEGKRPLKSDPFPEPTDYVVSRWNSDPFSLGSYSYLKLGANWQQIEDLAAPYPQKDPRIFFAGEATSLQGIQCVTGAYKSGIRSAKGIMTVMSNKRRIKS